ncbi:MFS transporter [Candidimonas nitroreducens]|uniref:MFS transporter n=1 Tax=Candidimonas nitroreducens TaxID=683354 RepID=A0A225MYP5_9BURK|nr:MFS transporter [Candidimonas nitroreducens]OWT66388.1 MFS transporter [Candidimonas nitroreducens]
MTTRRPYAVAAVYLGTFMASLAISIVSVALPAIQADLGVSLSGLQWVVGAYTLCLSAFMLSAGPLADRYGRKRIWLSGVAVFTFGSAICSLAPSLAVLIAGCALQGVGGALVIPGALSILTQAFPDPAERAHVIGGWSSFSAISLILGPMLGGLLVDHVGWPSIFLVNLPIGAVTMGLGFWGVQESANPDHAALDPAGQALSVVFLGVLTYALISAGHDGWNAGPTVTALLGAAVAFVLFIVVELRTNRPVLPVDLFRRGDFACINFASFVLGFSGYSSLFLFSLFLQQAQDWSATQTGWRMAPVFLAMGIVSPFFGRLARRYGTGRLMLIGYVLLGMSMLAMAAFTSTTPYSIVAPCFALLGIALGLTVPATGAAAMASAPRERTGAASATMNALRQGGMTIGIALLGTFMSVRAVASLERVLSGMGIANAAALAGIAVHRHEKPAALYLAPDLFKRLLEDAYAHGFGIAAALAGALGLAAAVALAIVSYRAKSALRAEAAGLG